MPHFENPFHYGGRVSGEKGIKLMRELFTRLYLGMGIDSSGNPQWNVGFDRSRELEAFYTA